MQVTSHTIKIKVLDTRLGHSIQNKESIEIISPGQEDKSTIASQPLQYISTSYTV